MKMLSLTDRIDRLFSSEAGRDLYDTVLSTSDKRGILQTLRSGVAVGFSGGPDSVMLLSLLYRYRKEQVVHFTLAAIHVNHMIRGENAFADAEFSRTFCEELGVEFLDRTIDVPAISKSECIGIEEAARNARYSAFEDILCSRNDIFCIALAHNATDNVETVIMNMLRGSGVRGMCGIPPVRSPYVRPLIEVPKRTLVDLLDEFEIPYKIDETNASDEYTRNYVRHNLLPHFERLSPSYERAVGRMVENMRSTYSLVASLADGVLASIGEAERFPISKLRGLHPAVFADAFSKLIKRRTGEYPLENHISTARELIERDNFSLSLLGARDLVCQRGICFFDDKRKKAASDVIIKLKVGENIIHGTNVTVFVESAPPFKDFSSNIYKFSISAVLNGDIINDGLILRFKRDGDAYKYGGITHRLKKVFNDRGIPVFMRDAIPVICDHEGILWVVGLGVRDGAGPKNSTSCARITVCFATNGERELFTALPYEYETNT